MSVQSHLNITTVQAGLHWEDPQANRDHFSALIAQADPTTDLIILPEMFTTGFSMNTAQAEATNGATPDWMRALAALYNAAVMGSVMIREADRCYNRLFFAHPDGRVEAYDKRHLFSFAGEHQHFTAGGERLIVNHRGWRICPLVCYDLRFPVWSRNARIDGAASDHEFDLLVYVANWPEIRQRPWTVLLEARAHENQCYVAGVNRIGTDGNGIVYSGDTAVFSHRGERMSRTKAHEERVETIALSMDELAGFREKFTPWRDKDRVSVG